MRYTGMEILASCLIFPQNGELFPFSLVLRSIVFFPLNRRKNIISRETRCRTDFKGESLLPVKFGSFLVIYLGTNQNLYASAKPYAKATAKNTSPTNPASQPISSEYHR